MEKDNPTRMLCFKSMFQSLKLQTTTTQADKPNLRLTSKQEAPNLREQEQTAAWRDYWEMRQGEENLEPRCSRRRKLRRAQVILTTLSIQHWSATRNLSNRQETSNCSIMTWSNTNRTNRKSLKLKDKPSSMLKSTKLRLLVHSPARNLRELWNLWRRSAPTKTLKTAQLMKGSTKTLLLLLKEWQSNPERVLVMYHLASKLLLLGKLNRQWTDFIAQADQRIKLLNKNNRKESTHSVSPQWTKRPITR